MTMNIQIKALAPELFNRYLYFFDSMVFEEKDHRLECYCFSFHFVGESAEWHKEAD